MSGASGGSSRHNDNSPGSRFSILSGADDFPILGNETKRKRREEFVTNSYFDKQKKLVDLENGPKYILMNRNEVDPMKTLNETSPFLIKKSIEVFAGNPKNITKLRNGTLLIETTNSKQATKLYQMKNISKDINVIVKEHPTLNTSKGTIFCPDLKYVSDDEILENLKQQRVVEVRRIKKKDRSPQTSKKDASSELIDTGVFIFTFNIPQIPTTIEIGYYKCDVKLYIPNPRRCFACQQYGHSQNFCNREPICGICSTSQHVPNPCVEEMKCINCSGPHTAWSRSCPVFKQEMEISKIQVFDRITRVEAKKKFLSYNPTIFGNPISKLQSYSQMAKTTKKTEIITHNKNVKITNPNPITNTDIIQYDTTQTTTVIIPDTETVITNNTNIENVTNESHSKNKYIDQNTSASYLNMDTNTIEYNTNNDNQHQLDENTTNITNKISIGRLITESDNILS